MYLYELPVQWKSTIWILLFHIWFTFSPLRGAPVQPASKLSSVSLSRLSPYLRIAWGHISPLHLNWLGQPATWRKLGATFSQPAVNKRLWPLNVSFLTPTNFYWFLQIANVAIHDSGIWWRSPDRCSLWALQYILKHTWPDVHFSLSTWWEPPSHAQQAPDGHRHQQPWQ